MVGAPTFNSLSELKEKLGFRVSTNLGDTLALDSTIRCLICPLGVSVAAPVTTLKAIYEL